MGCPGAICMSEVAAHAAIWTGTVDLLRFGWAVNAVSIKDNQMKEKDGGKHLITSPSLPRSISPVCL